MITTKSDIINGLESSFEKMIAFINSLDKNQFELIPNGKWSAGQQLDHLIRSTKPLNLAFRLPGFIFPLLFGKMNRASRTFDELQLRYTATLAKGGKASGRFIPPVINFEDASNKIRTYLKEKEKLIKNIQSFTELQLDTMLLPHPLLGKLTLREMMFFTIFHTEHHLNNLIKEKLLFRES